MGVAFKDVVASSQVDDVADFWWELVLTCTSRKMNNRDDKIWYTDTGELFRLHYQKTPLVNPITHAIMDILVHKEQLCHS